MHVSTAQPANQPSLETLHDRIRRGDLAALEEIARLERETAIPELASYVWLREWKSESAKLPGASEAAAKILIGIPGHAEYFAKRIERAQTTNDYDTVRWKSIRMLSYLRSVESVEILGRLLSDSRIGTRDPTRAANVKTTGPNAFLAAQALGALNIPQAPTTTRPDLYTRRDLPLWQRWWKENEANIETLLAGPQAPQPSKHASPSQSGGKTGSGRK